MIEIRNLSIRSPRGDDIFVDADLCVEEGEILVLLGPSGAGKSTLTQFVFDKSALVESGFVVDCKSFVKDDSSISMIPQKGALFDHLSVYENVDLAARYSGQQASSAKESMLNTGCDEDWISNPVATYELSGGEAQRVAVARALASGSDTIVMDEPTVGLDPGRVNALAKTIVEQKRKRGTTFIVVTHDIHFAVSIADRFVYVGGSNKKIETLSEDSEGQTRSGETHVKGNRVTKLHQEISERVLSPKKSSATKETSRSSRSSRAKQINALVLLGFAFGQVFPLAIKKTKDFFKIFLKSFWIAALRPIPFYLFVSTLLGATVLYVVSSVGGAGLRPGALIEQMGGAHVLALAPALSGVLFAAVSANGINAWLGQFELSKQSLALRALKIEKEKYLLVPLFWGLVVSYLLSALLFVGGMLIGGWLLSEF